MRRSRSAVYGGAKFSGFVFELRDAFCGSGQLLIERRLFPLHRVDLAVGFMEFALARGYFLRGRGMLRARLLQLLADFFQPLDSRARAPARSPSRPRRNSSRVSSRPRSSEPNEPICALRAKTELLSSFTRPP